MAILADWRRYYPNQFGDNSLPLVNPPTPIKLDSPLNSPASPVFQSPKMRPAAQMKSLLDRVVKRHTSSSTGSALVPPPGPSVSLHAPPRRTRLRPLCSYFLVVWRAFLLPLPTRQIRLHRSARSCSSRHLICPFGWHPTAPRHSWHLHC